MVNGAKANQQGASTLLYVSAVLLVGLIGLAIWRCSLPWRVLSPLAGSEASWDLRSDSVRIQPLRISDGPLTLIAPIARAESPWLDLLADGTINLLRIVDARIEFADPPDRFQEIDFSRWSEQLRPDRLPVDKLDFPNAKLKIPIFPATLELDVSAIRNRAGALESTAHVEGGGLTLEGFCRLGWDSLESGGSFDGTYLRQDNPFFFAFFGEEPFRSLLRPFRQIQFEGSFVLDSSWRFSEGIRLITAAQQSADFGGEELRELAFSGATVFPNSSHRENRAILEGLLADETTFFQIEINRRADGPIRIDVSVNESKLFRVEASAWVDDASARMILDENEREIPGRLRVDKAGGLVFTPAETIRTSYEPFHLPGIFGLAESLSF
ncbi:MAG: hypothetical protein AAGJ81_11595 [Verrucomicrobiota bacterium]